MADDSSSSRLPIAPLPHMPSAVDAPWQRHVSWEALRKAAAQLALQSRRDRKALRARNAEEL